MLEELSKPDQCLVHRFLYYCKAMPVISDYAYDLLEREAEKEAPPDHDIHRPGSSWDDDYSQEIKDAAEQLIEEMFDDA